jgi:phosphoglycerate dehydrogenase-like enzyme
VLCAPAAFFVPGFESLREEFADSIELVTDAAADPEALLREIEDADAVIGIPPPAAFSAARRLRWVHQPYSGINMAADHPLIASDCPLTNAPDAHVPPMADWVYATMLSWTHRMEEHFLNQRAKRWAHADGGGAVIAIILDCLSAYGRTLVLMVSHLGIAYINLTRIRCHDSITLA